MVTRWLACRSCGAEFDLGPYFWGCPRCADASRASPLEVQYDLDQAAPAMRRALAESDKRGLWGFHPLLPVQEPDVAISLGEGGTPLVRVPRLDDDIGVAALYLKNEGQQPTWSWKDRFNAVTIATARELGFSRIVSSSTGNHGASAAAYAAAAGMRCVVLLPDETPALLGDLIEAYGARAVVTRWQGRGPLLATLVRDYGWFPATTLAPMPAGSPYGIEGYKTIAYELIQQSHRAPLDFLFVPVGGGDGLYGIYKGWRECCSLGLVDDLPRFVACQPVGANPVVRAIREGHNAVGVVTAAHSMATSVREETAGDHVLEAVRASNGLAIDVAENEIRDATRLLARHGLAAEAASALAVAALIKASALGLLPEGARVGAVLTSMLLKWPEQLAAIGERPVTIEPTAEALRQAVAVDA
ncbi:MAG: pyridoxal-phosphate dependent enzyme [Thermomicrobiales bacterium]